MQVKKAPIITLLTLMMLVFNIAEAQTVVFQENFEGTPISLTSSASISGSWAINNRIASQGVKCDSATVVAGDTIRLTSNTFSTVGNSSVYLSFDHICKIEFADYAIIEVSNNGGSTWVKLTGAEYAGAAQFATLGNKFSVVSYVTDWDAVTNSSVPQNTWWKSESFDISNLLNNTANAKIRFTLYDGTTNGSNSNAGWFIDNVKITGSFSELIPPTITIIPPTPVDTTYLSGPYEIRALVTDASSVDTVKLHYSYSVGGSATIGMARIAPDTFAAFIPFAGFGTDISYYVIATDSSLAFNTDSTNIATFNCKYNSFSSVEIGTCASNNSYGPIVVTSSTSTYKYSNHISVFTAAEIGAGGLIQQLSWNKTNTSGYTLGNATYKIYLKHSTLNAIPTTSGTFASELVGATLVYSSLTQNIPTTIGWEDYLLDTTFLYNGSDNLMVLVDFHRPGNTTGTINHCYTTATGKSQSWAGSSANPTYSYGTNTRPDIKINFKLASLGIDIGVYDIISPSAGVAANVPVPSIIRIKNYGTDTITSAQINWAIDGVAQTPYLYTGILYPDSISDTLTIGTTILTGGNHTFTYCTDLPNNTTDMNTGNDCNSNSIFVCNSIISGSYTVGPTGDFTSFADVMQALNQCGIGGPTVFNIAAGTYTEQVEIGQIGGVSATNTISFQGVVSDSNAVVLRYNSTTSASNYVVNLNGASHIKFKNMTMKAVGSNFGTIISLTNSASDIEISGCVFSDSIQYTGTSSNSDYNLINTGNSVGNNILIENSKFTNGTIAIDLVGDQTTLGHNWVVSKCDFQENALCGVQFTYAHSALAEKNNFFLTNGIIRSYNGIAFNFSSGSCVVSKNKMDIGATSAAHPIKFNRSNGDTLNPHLIVNNFIHYNQLNQSHWGCAINMFNATYVNVYHNSISVTGTYTNTANFQIYDANVSGFPSGNIDIKNNIFTNSIPGARLYRLTPANFSFFTNDYNMLYTYGVGEIYGTGASIASTISQWRTASGEAAHSDTLKPYYTSPTDLHVNTNQLDGTGTFVGIYDDFDGDMRDTIVPDIGADEFVASPYDPGVIAFQNPVTACGLSANETITVKIKNYGSAPIYGNLTVGYNINNATNSIIQAITDTIQPADTLIFSFNATVNFDVSSIGRDSVFEIKAWAQYPGDNFTINDTFLTIVNSYYLPQIPVNADVTSNYGAKATLTASSPNLILWYTSDTSITPIGSGTSFQTPFLYDTTMYWVSANTTFCQSARDSVNVNVIGFPAVDAGTPHIVWPKTNVVSNVNEILQVELANYGTSPLTSAQIHWTINGQHDSILWTGNILYGVVDTINLDTLSFGGGIYNFQSWSAMPNNIVDATTTNDSSAMVTFNACLSGSYTIGDTAGGAIYDFPSFTSAVNTLTSAGICGNVTFLVDSGTYEERLEFPQILGAGPNARITFTSLSGDSTDVTLHYTLSTAAAFAMKFTGSYYTLSNMTLSVSGSSSYSRVMEIVNGATHNEISNCVIEGITTSSSSTNYALIYASGANISHTLIKNNIFLNGAYSVYFYGSSTLSQTANTFEGNAFKDFYYYGPYFYYQDGLTFNSNTITTNTTSTCYAVRMSYCMGSTISKNIVDIESTSSIYGIYYYYCDGTAQNPGLISNNSISTRGGSSTHYSLYSYNSSNTNVYNNTLRNEGSSTISKVFYHYDGSNNNIFNNIFAEFGTGYAYYVTGSSAINSDFNNLFSNGTYLGYWGSAATDLATFQSVSSKEANSLSIMPSFYSNTDLHLTNTSLSAKGQTLSEVTDDIDGNPRGVPPTIGSHEVPLIPNDAGVVEIINPMANATLNEASSSPVSVVVSNFGTDTIFSMSVQYSVNGGTPVSIAYNDTLISLQSDTITMTNFTVPAGNSSICAETILANDTNTFNDQVCNSFFGSPNMDVEIIEIAAIDEGCDLAIDTVSLLIRNNGNDTINGATASVFNAYYQIDGSTSIVNQTINATINPGDSLLFTFTTLVDFSVTTTDHVFEVKAWVKLQGDNIAINDTALIDVESMHTPPIPTATSPIAVAYATPATLIAASSTNDSLVWFDAAFGGNKVHEGAQYVTPFFNYVDTSFYVEAQGGSPIANFTFGTGTSTNTNTGFPSPFVNYYEGNKEQYLFYASELTAMGLSAGEISSVAFDVDNVNSCPVLQNFEIAIGHSTKTTMTSFKTNPTTVHSNPAGYQPVNGWNEFVFDFPFVWDGVSNLIIQVCSNNSSYVSSGNASVKYSTTPFVSTANRHADAANVCSDNTVSSSYSYRPNIKLLAGGDGCQSPRVKVDITVNNQVACDVGVSRISSPNDGIYMSASETVSVVVRNYGTSSQSNVPVNFRLDNGTLVTETIATAIPANDSLIYTFNSTANLNTVGNTYQLKAFTSLACDNTHLNDTVVKSAQNLVPNYCNSTALYTSYHDVENLTFGGINNTSSGPFNQLYTDYTSVGAANISQANNHAISVTIASSSTITNNGYCKVYIDYNRDGAYDESTEMAFESAYTGVNSATSQTVTGTVSVPMIALSGLTQMRVVTVYTGTSTSVTACGTYSYGETEDYTVVIAPRIAMDAGVEFITNPSTISNTLTPALNLQIRNYGYATIPSVDISYVLNNGTPNTITYSTPIFPGDSALVTFGNITLNQGQNTICAYTTLAGDSNTFNNQECITSFIQSVVSIPYSDDFETADLWFPDTIANQWKRGVPAMTNINTAHSPVNVWGTNLSGNYANNSNDKLYTPKFVVPNNVDSFYVKFWHTMHTQSANDGGYIEYRTSSGNAWISLGYMTDPKGTNWYTHTASGINMWTGTIPWQQSSYLLNLNSVAIDTIQFRFIFYSNASTNAFGGWAIDDFEISLPQVAIDGGITVITSPAGSAQIGAAVSVSATIKNFGTSPLTSIPLSYTLGLGNPVNEVYIPSGNGLAPGASDTYNFNTSFMAPSNDFALCVSTHIIGDIYANNDKHCETIAVSPANIDIAVIGVKANPSWHDTTKVSYATTISVTIVNKGLNTVTSIPLEAKVASSVINDTWTGIMNHNDTITYTFTQTYNSPMGTYTLSGESKLANDANATNNRVSKVYVGILDIGGIGNGDNDGFSVSQNIPNPASGLTLINYYIPNSGKVKFELSNSMGQSVMVSETSELAGENSITIDANSLSAGVYYFSIQYDDYTITKKMVVSK